ncbi:MAG: exo-alpha-sialidase [Chitinophagaceae bacterium]|nr:exo-alpha-sialidase [Chitinophagaceae bacterium]MCW5926234.1 exo-alpha-sialidase [Chitinophagaceae bacterium]
MFLAATLHMGYKTSHTSANSFPTVMKIDPGPDNPRNSEGDFISLKDGSILLVYSRYYGESGSDHATARLTSRESKDGGKTWSTDDKVVVENEGLMNVMSVSLLRLQTGHIALFYLRKNSQSDCIPMMRISTDEAQTWSEPVPCITDRQGYFVLNNDRVIQLNNGRLLMAVALHQTPEEGKWHNDAVLYSYYSDDNGKTWTSSPAIANPDNVTFQEPGVVELMNGDIMMIIRTGGGVQYKSYSKDKGQTWSPGVATDIRSPLSPATIQRISSTGDLLMVWNNNGGDDPVMKGKRTPLTIAVSKDEGNTWQYVRDIETDPDGWYCYTAMHFVNNEVLLGYCAGSQQKKTHLSVLAVRRLAIKKIYRE